MEEKEFQRLEEVLTSFLNSDVNDVKRNNNDGWSVRRFVGPKSGKIHKRENGLAKSTVIGNQVTLDKTLFLMHHSDYVNNLPKLQDHFSLFRHS